MSRDVGAPDWERLTEELHCPLCTYNLRGLAEPRCPECGYRFGWAELTDPTLKTHPYLFEHHPKRWIWSFWRTAVGGLRPVRFWKGINPQQKSRRGRMLLYWLLAMAVGFISVFGMLMVVHYMRLAEERAFWVSWIQRRGLQRPATPPIPLTGVADAAARDSVLRTMAAIALSWPAMTWLTLQIFFQSMARAKVRGAHVLRCVVYSSDAAIWLLPFSMLVFSIFWLGGERYIPQFLALSIVYGGVIAAVLMIFRLYLAYKLYLRFDHPFLTILASQIIGVLLAVAILLSIVRIRLHI